MLAHIWNKRERKAIEFMAAIWILGTLTFYFWWFNPRHVGSLFGYTLTTLVLTWGFAMSAYCMYLVYNMRKVRRDLPLPKKVRVAMVVTKVPSEPLALVQKTLLGALTQKYPHDTWVADEDPTTEAKKWYKANGVKLSCRKDNPNYHNEYWPRRKKSKEGNLAYFYDHYGYKQYDIVVHLDADHVPARGYLEEMLKPFSLPAIGYVAAPSVCDRNAATSWASRARLQAEAIFHGPIQSGASKKFAPICIGSHYAVRTKALHDIGGIGPELAEDYSTSLLMRAHGWRGAWAYTAEAHGDGPNTFADLMVQDFQWAKSMMILFLTLFPKVWRSLDARGKLFFTFTQLWYTASTLVWLTTFLLPLLALFSGTAPVHVPFAEFLLHAAPPFLISMLLYGFIRRRKHMRPHDASFFSWENGLFELARWPWVGLALLSAVVSVLRGEFKPSRVTPKGNGAAAPLPFIIILPYIVLSMLSTLAYMFRQDGGSMYGYAWFTILNGVAYAVLTVAVMALHAIEAKRHSQTRQWEANRMRITATRVA